MPEVGHKEGRDVEKKSSEQSKPKETSKEVRDSNGKELRDPSQDGKSGRDGKDGGEKKNEDKDGGASHKGDGGAEHHTGSRERERPLTISPENTEKDDSAQKENREKTAQDPNRDKELASKDQGTNGENLKKAEEAKKANDAKKNERKDRSEPLSDPNQETKKGEQVKNDASDKKDELDPMQNSDLKNSEGEKKNEVTKDNAEAKKEDDSLQKENDKPLTLQEDQETKENADSVKSNEKNAEEADRLKKEAEEQEALKKSDAEHPSIEGTDKSSPEATPIENLKTQEGDKGAEKKLQKDGTVKTPKEKGGRFQKAKDSLRSFFEKRAQKEGYQTLKGYAGGKAGGLAYDVAAYFSKVPPDVKTTQKQEIIDAAHMYDAKYADKHPDKIIGAKSPENKSETPKADVHTDQAAKIDRKHFEKMAENAGNEAYGKAAEAQALKSADASGLEAKEQALAAGKGEKAGEKAYDDAFRETYAKEKGKQAYQDEMKASGKEAEALEKQKMAQNEAANVKLEDIKPGSKHFEKHKGINETPEQAKRTAQSRMMEKMESTAKFSEEPRILKHADAKGTAAKKQAMAEGKSKEAQERAYNAAFRETYVNDKGKHAYEREMQKSGDKTAALEKQKAAEELAAKRLAGSKINRIKPGSKYYDLYDSQRKTDVTAKHGEFEKGVNAVGSKKGEASLQYLSGEKNASARRDQTEKALPRSNTAEVRENVEINARNDDGKNVFAIKSTVGAKLHEQDTEGSPFAKTEKGQPKLVGGGEQVVLNTGGKYDGSAKVVEKTDSPEMIAAKKAYADELAKHGVDANALKKMDINGKWEKVEGAELDKARADFNNEKDRLISQWEQANGKEWPRYEEDVYGKDGNIIHHKGDKYDAHHVQPLSMGGRNTADNIVPLHHKDHVGSDGLHNSDAYKNLEQAMKAGG